MDLISQYGPQITIAAVFFAVLIVALIVWRTISPRVLGRRGQRIGISEYHELDKMRRLVLVRRDNVEHLILIGGPQDVVIETGIGIPGQSAAFALPPALDDSARPGRPAPPRPPVFGDSRPPPPLRSVDAPSGPPGPPAPPHRDPT